MRTAASIRPGLTGSGLDRCHRADHRREIKLVAGLRVRMHAIGREDEFVADPILNLPHHFGKAKVAHLRGGDYFQAKVLRIFDLVWMIH